MRELPSINKFDAVAPHKSRSAHLAISDSLTLIEEARTLVQHCIEPRLASESTKAAIRRASQLLRFPFSRTKDLWYGDSRLRIHANEMDTLRRAADRAEVVQAIAAIELTIKRLLVIGSPSAVEIVPDLKQAIELLRDNCEDCSVRDQYDDI